MSKTQLAGMSLRALDASRGIRVGRWMVAVVMMALVVTWAAPASAQQAKCLAGKTKCMATKAGGLLKCDETAETPGKPTGTTACVTTVTGKFDGGADPSKGCFAKLESKKGSDCITTGDTAAAENAVDSCTTGLVSAIDPPPSTQSKCNVGKKKCIAKYLATVLKCQSTAQTPGKPTDTTACVDKAKAKYSGGTDTSKGCFAKLEAKTPNDCSTTGNSSAVEGLADACATSFAALLTTPSTTTTTTSGATTTTTQGSAGGVLVKGALAPTMGRFNFNAMLGLPGANAACNTNFAGTHACTYQELQTAAAAGDLKGLKDISTPTPMTVTSFWAIDSSAPALQQCNDDVSSHLNWEYATAHTMSRGEQVALDNAAGTLGALQTSVQCNFGASGPESSWVACCQ